MLVPGMFMQRHLCALAVSNEGSGWSANPISVQAKDFHTLFVGLPCNLILVIDDVKEVKRFQKQGPVEMAVSFIRLTENQTMALSRDRACSEKASFQSPEGYVRRRVGPAFSARSVVARSM